MRLPSFLGRSQPEGEVPPSEGERPEEPPSVSGGFLVQLAEEVWRLEKRVDRAQSTAGEEALRGIRDSAVRLKDALSRSGVHAEDNTGDQYREGLRLTVLHVDGSAGDSEALWIVETVKPTVIFLDHVISVGQVVLGDKPNMAPSEHV